MKARKILTSLTAIAMLAGAGTAAAGTLDLQQDRKVEIAPAWAAPDAMGDLVAEHATSGLVHFRPGSAEMTAESRERLDMLPMLLPQDGQSVLMIGNVDAGDPLAVARASAVQDYLAARGVTETQLVISPANDTLAAEDGALRISYAGMAG
ncbi:hypothetical protein ACFOGJ_15295 [Marinibaculum pumilum]|uniref:OmpA-like domain-containing protein n=1 Tax=Marinibaculum pumilum TaxID=1766165 RepID=A0ABV7L2G5_9PROT